MEDKHEDQVCNTLVQFIAKRKGVIIDRGYCPDKDKDNNQPSVDRLVKCSGLEIVLEHTLIESYPEQIADHCRIKELLGHVKSEVEGQLPIPGHYELSLAVGAVKGAKDTKSIQRALIRWIENEAPSLLIGSPDVAPRHCTTEKPAGVPFEVTLYRWPGNDGKFYFSLIAPENLEAKRAQRIREALEKKCPKLHNARGKERVSILLLEADDISLGNHLQINKALTDELSSRNDVPDDIYLVSTELEEWCVWILKEGTKLFRDIQDCGPHYLHAATQ